MAILKFYELRRDEKNAGGRAVFFRFRAALGDGRYQTLPHDGEQAGAITPRTVTS